MKIKLTNHQQNAFNELVTFSSNKKRTHVLSGCAGTGKSTLIIEYINYLDENGIDYHLTATTHKAANVFSQMKEGTETSTIHSLLNLKPEPDLKTGIMKLKQTKRPAISTYSIIMCDEASMCDEQMINYIAETGAKVLYIGDSYQLPPVFASESPAFALNCPQSRLTEIMRQALDNPLLSTATAFREVINGAKFPRIETATLSGGNGLYLLDRKSFDRELLAHFESDSFKNDNDYCRVMGWTNNCSRDYNELIRRETLGITSPMPTVGEIYITNSAVPNPRVQNELLLTNDTKVKISQIADCHDFDVFGYDVELEDIETGEFVDVFVPEDWDKAKGLMGEAAKEANRITKEVKAGNVKLESKRKAAWRKFFKIKNTFADIRPAYAVTVHKSQGSTFDTVFIDLDDICKNKKGHEVARLLYVAMTRPKNKVYITGSYSNWINNFNQQDKAA